MSNMLNYTLLFIISLISLFSISVHALDIGVQPADSALSLSPECSRKCESKFCSVPPFLRYGKYCGILYTGCPGEKPCDGLDACRMKHDACVHDSKHDYISQKCSRNFLKCVAKFKKSSRRTFEGNTCDIDKLIHTVTAVMKAALEAGRFFHRRLKPSIH